MRTPPPNWYARAKDAETRAALLTDRVEVSRQAARMWRDEAALRAIEATEARSQRDGWRTRTNECLAVIVIQAIIIVVMFYLVHHP